MAEHFKNKCYFTLSFLLKQIKSSIFQDINVLTFLPVLIVILWNKSIEQNIIFLKQLKGYTKTRGSSAATNVGVKLHLFLQCSYYLVFQTWVLKVRKADNFETTGQWVVTTRQDGSKTDVQATYDFVLVCNGHYYEPKIPIFPGIEAFKGTIVHTHDYKDFRGFENKRILVIGIGNSAADVACELSHHARHVSRCVRLRDIPLKRASVDHRFKYHVVFIICIHTRFVIICLNSEGSAEDEWMFRLG